MIRPLAFALSGLLMATPLAAQQAAKRVPPSQLGQYWVRTNSYVDAQAPNSGRGLNAVGCAAVSYTIGADGVTRDVKVEKVVPATSDFQVTASSLVAGLRYRAAADNPHDLPVATYFIVPFNVPDHSPEVMAKVLESCRLPGYGD